MTEALSEAARLLDAKVSVPSDMRTAEWSRLPQWQRERAFYMAGVARAEILEEFRSEAAAIAAGERGMEESRKRLEQFLDGVGYQADPDDVGTIRDLRSMRRIHIALRTNVQLLQGWAQKERGLAALGAFPAWELVRFENRRIQREWKERWIRAGGKLINGRMIALKTDGIWFRLGHEESDSLGVDYPPFAWGSGMGWRAISRRECKALGLLDNEVLPPRQVVSSPNESLQAAPKIETPEIKTALSENLKGLAEWKSDVLVFTDPNGTRPYAAAQLAKVVTAELPEGFPQVQAAAVQRHVNAGLMLGELEDDFLRFAKRTEPLAASIPVYRGEANRSARAVRDRLNELLSDIGATVTAIAESWTLDAAAAFAFASGRGMKHRLILETRKHGSLREIWQTAEIVAPSSAGQKEVVALLGTRFRMVGRPSVVRGDGVVETRIFVEEVPA
jgi:hypothetical protein